MPQSVTAAPHPVKLDGKDYLMSPLTDGDFEQLNNWLRSGVIQMARQSMTPDMTSEEREETLAVAMREARKMSYLSEAGRAALASVDGTAQLVWLGLRHNHPNLTADEVRSLVFGGDDSLAVLKVWEEINLGESSSGMIGKIRRQALASLKNGSTPSSPDSTDTLQQK